MTDIIGVANITQLPPEMTETSLALAYWGVANQLKEGINILAASVPVPTWALSLLCGQALECLLKSFIATHNNDFSSKQRILGHDIDLLWQLAVNNGLNIDIPAWATTLSHAHKAPYHLRYAHGLNGLVLPNAKLMVNGLNSLYEVIHGSMIFSEAQ